MGLFGRNKPTMVDPASALRGRSQPLPVPERHEVLDAPLKGPFPEGVETAIFGMGCFWGAERIFWEADGRLHDGGRLRRVAPPRTPPTRRSAAAAPATPRWCSSRSTPPPPATGHAEAVLGEPRPDPGDAPGQRCRHPVPLADHVERGAPAARARCLTGGLPGDARRGRLWGDHHRARRGGRRSTPSTTPRTITSSTSRRTRPAIAAWVARASPARSASPVSSARPTQGAKRKRPRRRRGRSATTARNETAVECGARRRRRAPPP